MRPLTNRWSLILAAGSGTRLDSLTRIGGTIPVPKQYWSLTGGPSLLEKTLERANSITELQRTTVVVASEHHAFWKSPLRHLNQENVVVQPRNCGTAIGILLGLAAILAQDSEANVVILPSDHFVAQESTLRRSILKALSSAQGDTRSITFLGIKPENADPELGYIVRGEPDPNGGFRVAEFVEKPSAEDARRLVARAALWNSFILVGKAIAFVDLIRRRYPREVDILLDASRIGFKDRRSVALERLYAGMPSIDFSRDVVQHSDGALRVMPVAACGWSDLGTPQRVAECLSRLGARASAHGPAQLSLAAAHERVSAALPSAIGQFA